MENPADCNLYVLDDSELYFDDLNLGSGGVYGEDGDGELSFEGGTLWAREVVCREEYLWIDEDSKPLCNGKYRVR